MIEQANLCDLPAITQIYNEYILEKTATADMRLVSTKERESWFKATTTLAQFLYIKKMVKF